jgi:hypothetical protein
LTGFIYLERSDSEIIGKMVEICSWRSQTTDIYNSNWSREVRSFPHGHHRRIVTLAPAPMHVLATSASSSGRLRARGCRRCGQVLSYLRHYISSDLNCSPLSLSMTSWLMENWYLHP